jgi:putative ABC transport system permease protein
LHPSDVFKLALKALLDRKVRSLLTVLGIMIGSAIILALIASSSGLSAGVQSQIDKLGANTLIIRAANTFFVSGGQSAYQLSQQDVSILKSFSGVQTVIPYYARGASITSGGNSISGTLEGIDFNLLFKLYNGLGLSEGKLPSPYDPASAAIGYAIAYPPGDTAPLTGVNQEVSVTISGIKGNLGFLVKGIFGSYGTVLFSNVDDTVFISLQAAQILLKTPYYSGFYVLVDNPDDVANVQQAITNYYGTNVRVISASAILGSVQAITGQMTVFLGSIGGVSLFVAAVGITNTMFVSVLERTREIGILKALGYNAKQILTMFLSEAVVTGAIGGVAGTMLGYGLSYVIGGALPLSGGFGFGGRGGGGGLSSPGPVFTPQLLLFSLTFPIGVAVLAGLYPAWRASRMNAVAALKYE